MHERLTGSETIIYRANQNVPMPLARPPDISLDGDNISLIYRISTLLSLLLADDYLVVNLILDDLHGSSWTSPPEATGPGRH